MNSSMRTGMLPTKNETICLSAAADTQWAGRANVDSATNGRSD